MGRVCTSDPPVAPDTHVWRQTPACGAKHAGILPIRRRRSELRVPGSVRPRRYAWCPAACRSALRARHLRKGQLPRADVGGGGLPRRWDRALSPLSGAWPPPFVAGAAVADHLGHLCQSSRSWWQPALALPPCALFVSDRAGIAADRYCVFRPGPSSHVRAQRSGLTNRCS